MRNGQQRWPLLGNLTGLLATLKGLPLAYNRDLQEDKSHCSTRSTISLALGALTGMIATAELVPERMAAAADVDERGDRPRRMAGGSRDAFSARPTRSLATWSGDPGHRDLAGRAGDG